MAASSSEQALRTRVEQLYGALQQSNWRQVEKYLTKDSKPIFRHEPKRPVGRYEIQSIKLEPSGDSAVVVVQMPVFTGTPAGPLPLSQKTHWRLLKGRWTCSFPTPTPAVAFQHASSRASVIATPVPSFHGSQVPVHLGWTRLRA